MKLFKKKEDNSPNNVHARDYYYPTSQLQKPQKGEGRGWDMEVPGFKPAKLASWPLGSPTSGGLLGQCPLFLGHLAHKIDARHVFKLQRLLLRCRGSDGGGRGPGTLGEPPS